MNSDQIIAFLKETWALLSNPLFELNGAKVSLTNVILACIVGYFASRLSKVISIFVSRSLLSRDVDSGVRDSIEKFARYTTVTIGGLFVLNILGFSLTSLAALGAVLMVGIGFGLQNITQNFISGIILLLERPIKVGDIIRVGDTAGKVVDIRVRATVVQTRDDISIIVPNSRLVAENVVNESFLGQRIRQRVAVGVAYGSDIKKVMTTLQEVACQCQAVIDSPPPKAFLVNFGESSLDFELRFWSNELWDIERVCSDLRVAIDKAFRENNIEIPFPQRVLHVQNLAERVL